MTENVRVAIVGAGFVKPIANEDYLILSGGVVHIKSDCIGASSNAGQTIRVDYDGDTCLGKKPKVREPYYRQYLKRGKGKW